MKTKQKLSTFLQNEPLIEWKLSLETIDWNSIEKVHGTTLFFGVGLCTAKEPGVAVPLDILQCIMEAERLRRFLSLDKVIVLIADQHALTNAFMTNKMVTVLASHMQETLKRIIGNLNLSHFELLLSSKIQQHSSFQKILLSVLPLPNGYLRREIADVIWLQKKKRVTIKLGWTIDSTATINGHDERFFDLEIRNILTSPISFFFTKAGMTFDKERPKASPYISVDGEKRLLLEQKEDVVAKLALAKTNLSPSQCGAVRRHLAGITNTFEKLFGTMPKLTLEGKLQQIIHTTTRENSRVL